jgi:hypothetical protein
MPEMPRVSMPGCQPRQVLLAVSSSRTWTSIPLTHCRTPLDVTKKLIADNILQPEVNNGAGRLQTTTNLAWTP